MDRVATAVAKRCVRNAAQATPTQAAGWPWAPSRAKGTTGTAPLARRAGPCAKSSKSASGSAAATRAAAATSSTDAPRHRLVSTRDPAQYMPDNARRSMAQAAAPKPAPNKAMAASSAVKTMLRSFKREKIEYSEVEVLELRRGVREAVLELLRGEREGCSLNPRGAREHTRLQA